jgi:hypothetical protein
VPLRQHRLVDDVRADWTRKRSVGRSRRESSVLASLGIQDVTENVVQGPLRLVRGKGAVKFIRMLVRERS